MNMKWKKRNAADENLAGEALAGEIAEANSVEEKSAEEKEPATVLHRVFTVVGIVMCVILVPILIINLVLIIQSYTHKDKIPTVFTVAPLIVTSNSMKPDIRGGDMIFIRKVAGEDVQVGDVIAFYDPGSTKGSIVTHNVIEILTDEDGNISFRTKGTANDTADTLAVPADAVIGRYTFRIPVVGSVALFMRTWQGFLVCVLLPLALLVGYDVTRRRLYDKKKQEALEAEIAALKGGMSQNGGETPENAQNGNTPNGESEQGDE